MIEWHDHEYYTTEELAERLGVTPVTVNRWRTDGKIACVKLGERKYLYSDEQITKFLQGSVAQREMSADRGKDEVCRCFELENVCRRSGLEPQDAPAVVNIGRYLESMLAVNMNIPSPSNIADSRARAIVSASTKIGWVLIALKRELEDMISGASTGEIESQEMLDTIDGELDKLFKRVGSRLCREDVPALEIGGLADVPRNPIIMRESHRAMLEQERRLREKWSAVEGSGVSRMMNDR